MVFSLSIGCSSLQVGFNISSVGSEVPLEFFIEDTISIVDVGDWLILIKWPSSAKCFSLFDSIKISWVNKYYLLISTANLSIASSEG